MKTVTFLSFYLTALVLCLALTGGIIKMLSTGLSKYFEELIQDNEISRFFVRMIILILFLGGFGAALENDYVVEKANWLTLAWDATDQVHGTMDSLFGTLITLSILFLVVELLRQRFRK
jgi:hypothetical protein